MTTPPSIDFKDTNQSLSQALHAAAGQLTGQTTTLRQVLALLGEQGLLVACAFLTLPFLIPVSIPGVSTVFGIAIILLGVAVTLNRVPWLPSRVADRQLDATKLRPTLEDGARFVARFDRFIRPRLLTVTGSALLNRIHGLSLIFGAVLLIMPFGLVPFSNTLPALAILFLALGIIQRDGIFVALGYLMNIISVVYFGALAVGLLMAGQGLGSLIGGG